MTVVFVAKIAVKQILQTAIICDFIMLPSPNEEGWKFKMQIIPVHSRVQ
jgi:hypothetical protein